MFGLWTMNYGDRLHVSASNSSKMVPLFSQNVIFNPKFAALSNGELFWSLSAVPRANILIFHGKFRRVDLKIEK
jgi:hypothetical protein